MSDILEEFAPSEEEVSQLQQGGQEPEPAPETTPQATEPTTGESPAPVAPVEPQPQKTVPLAALHEARLEIKDMQRRLAAVDDLKNQIIAIREANKPKPEPAPAFEDDFLGATKAGFEHVNRGFETVQQELARRDQALQTLNAQLQQQQVITSVVQAENVFRKSTPDYDAAYAYLKDMKVQELAAYGVTDPDAVMQALTQDAWATTMGALQKGLNPAQVTYQLATLRGYKKAGEAPAQAQETAPIQTPAAQQAQQRFAQVQQGQQAAKGLQGGQPAGNVTAEALLEASGDDFDRMWAEMFKSER